MADKNTSTVIVALPAPGEDVYDFGPEQKHATLLYFGEIDDFTAGWLNAQIMKVVSDGLSPFTEPVLGMTTLGEDDPPATVLKMGPGTLESVRNRLLEADEVREAWESIDQYPNFTPHVTLGYGEELSDDDRDDAPYVVKEITFDRLALWHKDQQIEYPLNFRLETVVAGAPRIVRTAEGAKRFGVPIGTEIRVDDKGKVTTLKAPVREGASGRGASTPPRPDPDRNPAKFVATVPGQKAKLPAVAGSESSSNGLGPGMRSAVSDFTRVLDEIDVSAIQSQAMKDVANNRPLSPEKKAALRSMIEKIFRSMGESPVKSKSESSKPEEKGKSSEQTAAEKAATEKAQKASSESNSPEKKAAQAKAQAAAAAKSAWLRSLRAAYAALGGNPKDLPNPEAASAPSASSESTKAAPSASSDSAGTSDLPMGGFVGMGDKQLTGAIRSLLAAAKADPNNSKVKNALTRARHERRRRASAEAERNARRQEFLANAGGAG